jgi:hypothetical protein
MELSVIAGLTLLRCIFKLKIAARGLGAAACSFFVYSYFGANLRAYSARLGVANMALKGGSYALAGCSRRSGSKRKARHHSDGNFAKFERKKRKREFDWHS